MRFFAWRDAPSLPFINTDKPNIVNPRSLLEFNILAHADGDGADPVVADSV